MSDRQTQSGTVQATGRIKWFNTVKGYGFIVAPNFPDIMLHSQTARDCGFTFVSEPKGVIVNFLMAKTDKGWRVTKVLSVEKE